MRATHGAAATALLAPGDFQLDFHDNSDKWRFERVRIHWLFLLKRTIERRRDSQKGQIRRKGKISKIHWFFLHEPGR